MTHESGTAGTAVDTAAGTAVDPVAGITSGTMAGFALPVAVMAAGVLLISAAYAAGRSGVTGHARAAWTAGYWAGEMLVFAPVVARVIARRAPSGRLAAALAAALAGATYLVKYAYSPAFFRFPDELEHWSATGTVLGTHHLFGVSYVLPVSPDYPGLEVVTSALVSVTGLPVFAAGLIIGGLAHVLLTTALYVVFGVVSGSPRIALAATGIYATGPHYQVFDSIFGYQTLALAFYGLVLVIAVRAAGTARVQHGWEQGRARGWALAGVLVAATVVTHHVSSYLLGSTFVLLAAVSLSRGRWSGAAGTAAAVRDGGLAILTVACIAGWLLVRAHSTIGYLSPAAGNLANGVRGALSGQRVADTGPGAPVAPLADRAAGYAAALVIMAGIPLGWRRIWRAQRDNPWALALGIGAAGYYLTVVLKLTAVDGDELAGRLLSFLFIPVGYTLALGCTGVRFPLRGRRATSIGGACALAAVLVAGGLATGWPPWWERLPGRYATDGFESGITADGIAAATWTRQGLGPGHRFAADYISNLLLGSYGGQDPVNGVSQLYCGPTWTLVNDYQARQQAIRYLLVDLRLSTHRPPIGQYFTSQSPQCPMPIPRDYLTKFDAVPGVSRLYDSGNIVIYELPASGAASAP
jgi:hypothetical protein